MNIHEYQAKALLRAAGAPVSDGHPVTRAEEAKTAAGQIDGPIWVVKAQIHAGGRGKGKFKELGPDAKGGVRLAKSLDEVRAHEMKLFRRMVDGLEGIGGITLYGPPELEDRVAIVPFNVEGVSDMLTAAVLGEEFGIAVRNGRFCSHVHSDRLLAGGDPAGAVRASIGLFNDETDVDAFLEAVEIIRRKAWKGTYTERGGQVSGQDAGRCADRWMENAENP